MQCGYVIEAYGVLLFPLVALTRRVIASCLYGGTLGAGREIEVLHATVCVINLDKRDSNFYLLLETSYSCVYSLCYIAASPIVYDLQFCFLHVYMIVV